MSKKKIGNIEYWEGDCSQNVSYVGQPIDKELNCIFSRWETSMPDGSKVLFKEEDLEHLMDVRELPKMLISRN